VCGRGWFFFFFNLKYNPLSAAKKNSRKIKKTMALALRVVLPRGLAEGAAAMLADLPPLVWEGAQYTRLHQQDGFALAELQDGSAPPLTPRADGSADPRAAERDGLLRAAAEARAGDAAALFHVNALCLRATPSEVNCLTAWDAEVAMETEAAACAACGAADGAPAAAYRAWRDSRYKDALRRAARALNATERFPERWGVRTALLERVASGAAANLTCHSTADEARDLLLTFAKVVACRAVRRAARAPPERAAEEAARAQAEIYFLAAHARLSETSRAAGAPADAPDGDVVRFADAHNALLGLLTAEPTARRAARTETVGGAPVCFAAPPREGPSAPRAAFARLRLLGEQPDCLDALVAPSCLDLDVQAVIRWARASGDGAPRAPARPDPGAADETDEYNFANGFRLSEEDALPLELGGAKLRARAVRTEAGLHTVGAFRVYYWQNVLGAELLHADACVALAMDKAILKRPVALAQPRATGPGWRTYKLKENLWYLRLEHDERGRLTALKLYAMHLRKQAGQKRKRPSASARLQA
jgi:hypothetical protein